MEVNQQTNEPTHKVEKMAFLKDEQICRKSIPYTNIPRRPQFRNETEKIIHNRT